MRCFLSMPAEVEAGELRAVLTRRDIQVSTIDDLVPTEPLTQALLAEMCRADLVMMVLPVGSVPPAMWMEAGLALGARRPLLVIDLDRHDLPFNAGLLHTVHAVALTEDAVGLHLDVFIAQLEDGSDLAGEGRAEYRAAPRGLAAAATVGPSLRMEVSRLLALAGGLLRELESGKVADFLYWLPGLDRMGLNPFLIQVNEYAVGVDPSSAVEQLLRARDCGARAGIVVFDRLAPTSAQTRDGVAVLRSGSFPVFGIDRSNLAAALENHALGACLVRALHLAAHAV